MTNEETRALVLSPPANNPTSRDIAIWRELALNFQNIQGQAIPGSIKTPEQAFAVIATGAGLGMDVATAFRQIYVIDGRTAISAEGLRAVVMARDPSAVLSFEEVNAERCTVSLSRDRLPSPVRMTIEKANVPPKLLKKDNWASYPMEMLIAYTSRRVISLGAPDLINQAPRTISEAEELMAVSAADDAGERPSGTITTVEVLDDDPLGLGIEPEPAPDSPTDAHEPPPEPPQAPPAPTQAPLAPDSEGASLEASAPPTPAPAQSKRPVAPRGEERPDPRARSETVEANIDGTTLQDRAKAAAAPIYRKARELEMTKMAVLYDWLGIKNDCADPLLRYWFEKADRGGLALETAGELGAGCLDQVAAELKENNASIMQAVAAVDPVGQLNHLVANGAAAGVEA